MNISNSQVNRLRHFVRAGLRSLFRPEPQTAVEWADANYYLPKESAYQEGRWETLPFQRAIMNAMGSDYVREVNVVKSARVGYSKMLLGVYRQMAATHTLPLASPGMARICLYGDLQRFGRRIDLRVKTGAEAIRALAMQIPVFRQKLSDGWYQVRIAGRDTGETELSARLNEPLANGAVIHIVPRLAGAKSGGVFQAVLGAAVMAVAIWMPGVGIMASNLLFSLGASMVLGGVAQMLAPKARTPRTQTTDNGKQNTYFSSLDNMVAQGNVLPVLYGEMRVGSRVVSQEISTADEGDGGQVVVIGR